MQTAPRLSWLHIYNDSLRNWNTQLITQHQNVTNRLQCDLLTAKANTIREAAAQEQKIEDLSTQNQSYREELQLLCSILQVNSSDDAAQHSTSERIKELIAAQQARIEHLERGLDEAQLERASRCGLERNLRDELSATVQERDGLAEQLLELETVAVESWEERPSLHLERRTLHCLAALLSAKLLIAERHTTVQAAVQEWRASTLRDMRRCESSALREAQQQLCAALEESLRLSNRLQVAQDEIAAARLDGCAAHDAASSTSSVPDSPPASPVGSSAVGPHSDGGNSVAETDSSPRRWQERKRRCELEVKRPA